VPGFPPGSFAECRNGVVDTDWLGVSLEYEYSWRDEVPTQNDRGRENRYLDSGKTLIVASGAWFQIVRAETMIPAAWRSAAATACLTEPQPLALSLRATTCSSPALRPAGRESYQISARCRQDGRALS